VIVNAAVAEFYMFHVEEIVLQIVLEIVAQIVKVRQISTARAVSFWAAQECNSFVHHLVL
jgi:hypothetical protein